MITSSVAQKSWPSNALDFFIPLQKDEVPEHDVFISQLTSLAQQIKGLVIHQFPLDKEEFKNLAEKAYQDVVKSSKKIDTLIDSKLFTLLVSTREASLKEKDHNYYKEDVVKKQIRGMSLIKKIDADFFLTNEKIVDWFCHVNETTQTAQERSLMRKAMKKIPSDFYYSKITKRVEIGAQITTRTLCENVGKLLKGEEVVDSAARAIFNQYMNHIINAASSAEIAEATKSNLIVSLGIRARQLPVQNL